MFFKKKPIPKESSNDEQWEAIVSGLRAKNKDLSRDLSHYRRYNSVAGRELAILNTAIRRRNATIKKLRAALKELRSKP